MPGHLPRHAPKPPTQGRGEYETAYVDMSVKDQGFQQWYKEYWSPAVAAKYASVFTSRALIRDSFCTKARGKTAGTSKKGEAGWCTPAVGQSPPPP